MTRLRLYMPHRTERLPIGRIPLPGVISASFMSLAASLGTLAGDFTQHSLFFLHFVALMSPLRHHPLILLLQLASLVSLFRASIWWKPALYSSCVHLSSFVFQTTQLSFSRRVSSELCLSSSPIVSQRKTVFESGVPHQHSSPLEAEGKKAGAATLVGHVPSRLATAV